MKRQPVASSMLRSVGYEPASETLEVEFTHGAIFQYFGVPEDVFHVLMTAPSMGQYFNDEVRDGGYDYIPVSGRRRR